MDPLSWLFDATLHIGSKEILWREIVGNAFGLASALGGMRRRVWAWPVGIAGNVLLFTVFVGAVFDTPQETTLWGQAGRQITTVRAVGPVSTRVLTAQMISSLEETDPQLAIKLWSALARDAYTTVEQMTREAGARND